MLNEAGEESAIDESSEAESSSSDEAPRHLSSIAWDEGAVWDPAAAALWDSNDVSL